VSFTNNLIGIPSPLHQASNPVEINGLDWWKRDGEVYIENWVFVDMIHLFRQLGVDLFERLAQQTESF
jgi:hypothetical protein